MSMPLIEGCASVEGAGGSDKGVTGPYKKYVKTWEEGRNSNSKLFIVFLNPKVVFAMCLVVFATFSARVCYAVASVCYAFASCVYV